jgi:multidrug efflux pump subunit AcrA (membrane-fusion protein)
MNDTGRKKAGAFVRVLLVFLFALLFVGGCDKNGSDTKGKNTPVIEKKEGKTEEGNAGVVLLAGEKLKGAGITVQKARKESVSAPLSATAAIEFNADRIARVSSRVAGRARGIRASQGDRVEARQTLIYLDTAELN